MTGRSTQYHDEVFDAIEAAATADASPGTFGVRDDLEIPELAQRPAPEPAKPKRHPAAERHAAEARDAIAAAEEAVARAQRDLENAEATLEAVRARYEDAIND